MLKEAKLDGIVEMYIFEDELRIKPAKKPTQKINDEALLVENILSDWLNHEEDKAWAHLQ